MAKTDIEDFALIAKAGLILIPLNGKAPVQKGWVDRAYINDDTLQQAKRTGCNLGVRLTEEHLVIDVDPRNGGEESLARLSSAIGIDLVAWTPATHTGSGGLHLWMKKPASLDVQGKLKDFPGIDLKTKGGQVVAPGSVHPDTGGLYVLDDPFGEMSALPELPQKLSDLVRKPSARVERTEAPRDRSGSPGDAPGTDLKDGWGVADPAEIAELLEKLNPEDFQGESAWFPLLCAVHFASGGAARAEFLDWSARDPLYADDTDKAATRWDSLDRKAGSSTTGTLIMILRENGVVEAGFKFRVERDAEMEDFADIEGTDLLGGAADSAGKPPSISADWQPQTTKRGEMVNNFTNALGAVKHGGLTTVFDEFRQTITFTNEKLPWPSQHGRLLSDVTARQARLFMLRKFSYGPDGAFWNYQPSTENVWDALLTVAERRVVNPLADWLSSLRWDGVPRVESLFPTYFKTGDDACTRGVSRCFMVGAVKRAYKPGCKFDTMPVLKGKQGKSKSTGVQALFGADWFSDADLNLRDKDAAVMLMGKWVHEFAELEGMTRGEVSTMKAFFSRGVDRLRPAYGRSVIALPRRCVFVGTVNEGGYLRDPTGNRRYWPLEVGGPDGEEEVDVAAIIRDRDQLWAEAVSLYRAGVSEELDRELWDIAKERALAETTEDPWAEDVRKYLVERAKEYDDFINKRGDFEEGSYRAHETTMPLPYRVHTTELLNALELKGSSRNPAITARLSTVMESSLGWKKREVRIPGNTPDRAKGYFDPKNDPTLD